MKTATVAELHEHLDEYLDAVRAGEAVEILDEKGQFARLVPPSAENSEEERLKALVAAGVLSEPKTREPLPPDFFARPLPKFSSGSVLEALLEERDEG